MASLTRPSKSPHGHRQHLLPIRLAHIAEVQRLPPIHRDPFDRLLVAQAKHEGLALVSVDGWVRRYPVRVVG